jgi:hypothetical protein
MADNFNMDIAKGLVNELGNVMKLAEQVISSIPNECKEMIPNAQSDISRVKEMINKGDSSGLTDLLKKYADSNNK